MLRKLLVGALFALVLGLTTLGVGSKSASAGVTLNVRVPAVRATENACEPGISPIALSGTFHHVWYTTPQGTLKMNIQGHLTGTDADGTEYILNTQQHMEHAAWPSMTPYTDRVRMNLISKGGTVNALIVMTFNVPAGGPVVPETSATACVG
ncbi:MAG: hypothetical protein FIB00_11405 [Chloroflexi bacterium]|jgi:hypothetical protein|nr:hypothetical protein [Chloroflexota bacterium]